MKGRPAPLPNEALTAVLVEHRVRCAACGMEAAMDARTRQGAAAEAVRRGWEYRTQGYKHGWRCPERACRLGGGRNVQAPPSDGRRRSAGHIRFSNNGALEYFERAGEVYCAKTVHHIGADGCRPGRWVSSRGMFDRERPDLQDDRESGQ